MSGRGKFGGSSCLRWTMPQIPDPLPGSTYGLGYYWGRGRGVMIMRWENCLCVLYHQRENVWSYYIDAGHIRRQTFDLSSWASYLCLKSLFLFRGKVRQKHNKINVTTHTTWSANDTQVAVVWRAQIKTWIKTPWRNGIWCSAEHNSTLILPSPLSHLIFKLSGFQNSDSECSVYCKQLDFPLFLLCLFTLILSFSHSSYRRRQIP